ELTGWLREAMSRDGAVGDLFRADRANLRRLAERAEAGIDPSRPPVTGSRSAGNTSSWPGSTQSGAFFARRLAGGGEGVATGVPFSVPEDAADVPAVLQVRL